MISWEIDLSITHSTRYSICSSDNKSIYASTSRGSYGSFHEDCLIPEGDTRKWDHVPKAWALKH